MSVIGQIEKIEVEIPIPLFSHLVFQVPEDLKNNENGCQINEIWVEEEHRRSSKRWDVSPIWFLRPVGKRMMAEVVHVTATQLVC